MIAVAVAGVEWVSEPTPGGRRYVAEMPRHWLIVYGDETILQGAWSVVAHARHRPEPAIIARGDGEKDCEAAKLRAIAVYAALVHDLVATA